MQSKRNRNFTIAFRHKRQTRFLQPNRVSFESISVDFDRPVCAILNSNRIHTNLLPISHMPARNCIRIEAKRLALNAVNLENIVDSSRAMQVAWPFSVSVNGVHRSKCSFVITFSKASGTNSTSTF